MTKINFMKNNKGYLTHRQIEIKKGLIFMRAKKRWSCLSWK